MAKYQLQNRDSKRRVSLHTKTLDRTIPAGRIVTLGRLTDTRGCVFPRSPQWDNFPRLRIDSQRSRASFAQKLLPHSSIIPKGNEGTSSRPDLSRIRRRDPRTRHERPEALALTGVTKRSRARRSEQNANSSIGLGLRSRFSPAAASSRRRRRDPVSPLRRRRGASRGEARFDRRAPAPRWARLHPDPPVCARRGH